MSGGMIAIACVCESANASACGVNGREARLMTVVRIVKP